MLRIKSFRRSPMGGLTHLLCKWHVMKNLRDNLRLKVSRDLYDEMWSEMKVIMNAKEESEFLKLKKRLHKKI